MTPVLVFDIETIPDIAGLRAAWGFDAALPDAEVAEQAFARRRERTGGSDFLPLHLHRVVAIGCLLRDERGVQVRCLGQPDESEARQIQQFFRLIDRHTPQLVTWNGGGFDLQVLHYRALVNQVQATRYWDQGEDDRDFKYNNYLSRYHSRHLDLMDLLAGVAGRTYRRDPQLLRNRRRQYLAAVLSVSVAAGSLVTGALPGGNRTDA
jgi:predicted PolB exonuclease-like 3'-5' exonuclease